jgi:Flp pilus assembly protein TadG
MPCWTTGGFKSIREGIPMARLSGVIRCKLSHLISDRSGAVAVITALSLTALIGIAGLGTEVSMWYVKKRAMQGAADSAAYSAAIAGHAGENSTSTTALADAISTQYGYTNGSNNVTVTVNNPPLSGGQTSNSLAYEVIIKQTEPLLISALFMTSGANITARAVAATTGGTGGNGCILALDTGNIAGVVNSGNSTVNINNCSMYVNSDDPNGALTMSGSVTINAWSAYMVGSPNITAPAQLNTSHGTFPGSQAATDPYAGTPVPTPGTCTPGYSVITSNKALPPGTYCNGMTIAGAANVTLSPGVYVFNSGALNIGGTTSVTCPTCVNGAGVTIVLTGNNTNGYSTISVAGGADVNITATTSGTYSGIAVYGGPNAPSTHSNSFNGGSNQNITGAIYFPSQTVNFTGGASTGGAQCTQLIANVIQIVGNTTFNNNCTNAGTKSIGGSNTQTALVE